MIYTPPSGAHARLGRQRRCRLCPRQAPLFIDAQDCMYAARGIDQPQSGFYYRNAM